MLSITIMATEEVAAGPAFFSPEKPEFKFLGSNPQEPVLFATTAMKNLKAMDESITDEQAIQAAKDAQIYDTLRHWVAV